MDAQCEIQISQQMVHFEIQKNRDSLEIYIDDIKQDASRNSCTQIDIENIANF